MTHSLLSSGYQLVALLFDGVIVRPHASAIGVGKAIQELRPKYGVRVTRMGPRRGVGDVGSEATLISREAGFGVRAAHRATGRIGFPGRWGGGVQFAPTSRQCALPNLRRRPRR